MTTKPVAKMWYFPSSSNPNKTYETLQYDDGSTSCQCRGWINRVAPDGSRSCTHTRRIDAGQAGVPAVDYTAGKSVQGISGVITKKPAVKTKPSVKSTPEKNTIPVVRHIQWD
ncbi:MAG: hypothetical protein NT096_00180 [Proteobacteria bacterium]|nr:hypothetical protein [Pseudomonadota bacterium]